MITTKLAMSVMAMGLPGATLLFAHVSPPTADVDVLGIPLKPDPPPAIDGDLAEWTGVPNVRSLRERPHVVYGQGKWRSSDDLNATVHLAWRREHLYLAVEVRDDRFRQTQIGTNLWKGDHVEFYIDAHPERDPERTSFGPGQFQIGLSPGNFERTGDPFVDADPEAIVYKPVGLAPNGILIAAKRTATGYMLEAAVPWALLGIQPSIGMPLAIEVGVSDTDSDEPVQESLMTLSTGAWHHTRTRLVSAVLSPADGKAPLVARGFDVFGPFELKPTEKRDVSFEGLPPPPGREAILTFNARLNSSRPAGYTPAMRLLVNGRPLDASRLVNKKPTEKRVNGSTQNMSAGDRITVGYAPDFTSPDTHTAYALRNAKVCEFAFRVTDLISPDQNTLVFENAITSPLTNPLIVSPGKMEFRTPAQLPQKKSAPTGPLDDCAPAESFTVEYDIEELSEYDWMLRFSDQAFRIESRFSTPAPKWEKGSNAYFKLVRRIEKRDEVVIVHDTFTNLTDANLPIMQRHRIPMKLEHVWLAGLSPATRTGRMAEPANPTTFGTTETVGIGLMPLDDVAQVHVENFSDGASIGLADNHFVLKPKATHTTEWVVFPVAKPDYFAFINAARRLREVNFTIDGGFAFLRAHPKLVGKWSDQKVADFIRLKDATYVCISIDYPRYQGLYPHGTAFQKLEYPDWKREVRRRRRLVPAAKNLAYFHCFIDVLDDADEMYADARVLRSDGSQANYGKPHDKIFFPAEHNTFGRDIAKNVDMILGELGFDGVYWDEIEYSRYRYHYGDPWDGVSADIDPKTMKIRRRKSSVTLISQSWRVALAERILSRGSLVGNGAPHTRTMTRLHFPRFIETGSISNLYRGQLYTPIALGDHLTERGETDAYRVMCNALDYGCLYHWYNDVTVIPTHHHLTRYMFPITPIELHEGYIIGKERIITNRSGLFGWNDDSTHEVHVFDDQGREISDANAPTITREGHTYTELRIAEDYSAAIIRRPSR